MRAFTVLDGLGKSLDKKFDISEISRPYARELLLDGEPQYTRYTKALTRRAAAQSQALVNLVKVRLSPPPIETPVSLQGALFEPARERERERERERDEGSSRLRDA